MQWLFVSLSARWQAFPFLIESHTLTSFRGSHLISGILDAAPLLWRNVEARFVETQKVMLYPAPHFTVSKLALEMYEKEVHSTYTCEQMFDSFLGQFNSVPSSVMKRKL